MKIFCLLIACFLLTTSHVSAQISYTLHGAYAYHKAPGWDNIVQTYNYARPWLQNRMPTFSSGYVLGLGAQYQIKPKFAILGNVSYSHAGIEATQTDASLEWQTNALSLNLAAVIYPFRAEGDSSASLKNGLFFSLGPSFSLFAPRVYQNGELFELEEDEPYKPMAFTVGVHAGLGYEWVLSPKLALSPFVNAQFYPSVTPEDIAVAVHGTYVPGEIDDKSVLMQLQAGLRVNFSSSGSFLKASNSSKRVLYDEDLKKVD